MTKKPLNEHAICLNGSSDSPIIKSIKLETGNKIQTNKPELPVCWFHSGTFTFDGKKSIYKYRKLFIN